MKVIEARAAHWLAPERQRRLIFEHYLNADAVRKFLTEDSIMPDPTPPAEPAAAPVTGTFTVVKAAVPADKPAPAATCTCKPNEVDPACPLHKPLPREWPIRRPSHE